ncbi:MAG: CoA pyrophosphatase [Chloroflexi bacterium]|nr:CoA pyrophosphatase [Chloroflexota bacterium]
MNIEKLQQALSRHRKLRNLDTSLIPSAVLIPIFIKDGEYHVIFTTRTHRVKLHKGEISFPGGAYEEEDETLLNTALRESAEEIGLAAKDVEVLGELDDFPTIGSNYIITPFVAAISWPYRFTPDPREVAQIIQIPISALLNKSCMTEETETLRGRTVTTYSYSYKTDLIWGASARILHQFLEIWVAVMVEET